jgi:hypothetical protein
LPLPSSRQDQIPLAINKSLSVQIWISPIGSGDRFSTFFLFNGVMRVTFIRDNPHNPLQTIIPRLAVISRRPIISQQEGFDQKRVPSIEPRTSTIFEKFTLIGG